MQDHRRWKLPQQPQFEVPRAESQAAFLDGPSAQVPRPFVPVLGVGEEQVTLGGGAALGLRRGDRLSCYSASDPKLRQIVGEVEVMRATLSQAETRIVSPIHRISALGRAVATHLCWPPTAEAPGIGAPKQAGETASEEVPTDVENNPLSLASLIRCWDPLGEEGNVEVSADRPDARYHLGETVRFTTKSPSPCYWLVVSVEPGDVVGLLYPNPWQPGKHPQTELNLLPPEAPVELAAPGPTGFWCVRAFTSDHPFECAEGTLAQAGPSELPSVRDQAAFLTALRRFLAKGQEEVGLLSAAGWTTGSVTLEVVE